MHYRFAFITGIIYVIYRRIRDIAYLVISTQLFGLIRATVFASDNRSIIASSLYSVSRPKIGIIQMKLRPMYITITIIPISIFTNCGFFFRKKKYNTFLYDIYHMLFFFFFHPSTYMYTYIHMYSTLYSR